jgi:hypothetical protein
VLVADGNALEAKDCGPGIRKCRRGERYSDRRSGNSLGLHRLFQSGAESIRFDSEWCPFWRVKSERTVTQKLLFSYLNDMLIEPSMYSTDDARGIKKDPTCCRGQ